MLALSSSFRKAVMVLAALLLAVPATAASAANLSGKWRGGGSFSLGGGSQERASCTANYKKTSNFSYRVTATCATPSGRVSQTAIVRGSGSRFKGSFYNQEWDARGMINISVNGRVQHVSLTGNKGSAKLKLRKSGK